MSPSKVKKWVTTGDRHLISRGTEPAIVTNVVDEGRRILHR